MFLAAVLLIGSLPCLRVEGTRGTAQENGERAMFFELTKEEENYLSTLSGRAAPFTDDIFSSNFTLTFDAISLRESPLFVRITSFACLNTAPAAAAVATKAIPLNTLPAIFFEGVHGDCGDWRKEWYPR